MLEESCFLTNAKKHGNVTLVLTLKTSATGMFSQINKHGCITLIVLQTTLLPYPVRRGILITTATTVATKEEVEAVKRLEVIHQELYDMPYNPNDEYRIFSGKGYRSMDVFLNLLFHGVFTSQESDTKNNNFIAQKEL